MNVWNKVLMILTGLLCLVFTVFAAQKYALVKAETKNIENLEKQLADYRAEVNKLKLGIYRGPEKDDQLWDQCGLEFQLAHIRRLQNGETFAECKPIECKIDEATKSAKVSFALTKDEYQLSSFRAGTVVYVFDAGEEFAKTAEGEATEVAAAEPAAEAEEGAASATFQFLGVFKATGTSERQIAMESIGNANSDELKALNESVMRERKWVVTVDRLPVDRFEELPYLAKQQDEELQSKLQAWNGSDLEGALEKEWATRDEQNVLLDRQTVALNDLTNVAADQIVRIGEIGTDVESKLASISDWDAIYQAAQGRKKVDSYVEAIAKETAALNEMNEYCAVVDSVVKEAKESIAACEKEIEEKIAANEELAAKIARCQFLAAEKIREKQTSSYAASSDYVYSGI